MIRALWCRVVGHREVPVLGLPRHFLWLCTRCYRVERAGRFISSEWAHAYKRIPLRRTNR